MELVWKYERLSSIPFLKSSIPFHSGIFHIPYRNFRSIPFSIPYHALVVDSILLLLLLLLLHFTPTVVASLKIRKRLILKKLLSLPALFQHLRFRIRFRFQPLSLKCFRFRFHKKLTASTASASTSLVGTYPLLGSDNLRTNLIKIHQLLVVRAQPTSFCSCFYRVYTRFVYESSTECNCSTYDCLSNIARVFLTFEFAQPYVSNRKLRDETKVPILAEKMGFIDAASNTINRTVQGIKRVRCCKCGKHTCSAFLVCWQHRKIPKNTYCLEC